LPLRLQIVLGSQFPEIAAERTPAISPPAATWPFLHSHSLNLDSSPAVVRVTGIHDAFVNHQTGGTRLVTTQATYLMLAWMDAVGEHDLLMVATADRESLETHAPEILERRGIFAETALITTTNATPETNRTPETGASRLAPLAPATPSSVPAVEVLATAMRVRDPGERLALCVRALDERRDAPALVATASVCMEVNDLDAARRDLDEALSLAPEWPAAHFEQGKLWLRLDDMEQAGVSFRAAAERLPRFGPAWSNLGATLGELDRTAEALEAFTRALECDRSSAQTLNNIGVLRRELGQLAESEAAFNAVIELAPNLAFGYYNLGHTLFLEGRYQAALAAYAQGQKRDLERNPVQATRLAMCRLATGDAAGALGDLRQAIGPLPADYRHQLLADTHTIAWALLTHRPDLPGWSQVNDWLTAELAR
jgi:tetratricopeptide (TPR) repeat protein